MWCEYAIAAYNFYTEAGVSSYSINAVLVMGDLRPRPKPPT
jgi:hypothetical protein